MSLVVADEPHLHGTVIELSPLGRWDQGVCNTPSDCSGLAFGVTKSRRGFFLLGSRLYTYVAVLAASALRERGSPACVHMHLAFSRMVRFILSANPFISEESGTVTSCSIWCLNKYWANSLLLYSPPPSVYSTPIRSPLSPVTLAWNY